MLSYSKPAADSDPLFQQESLTLKEIMNLARGAPIKDWPPPPPFKGLFRDIKDAIGRGELPAARHPSRPKFDSVRLLDLWLFVRDRHGRWEPIRDVCHRWAIAQDMTIEQLTEDREKTHTSGRPSLKHEIRQAYRELEDTGKIDFNKPRTETYEPIRRKIRKALGVTAAKEVAGVGDETIRQVVAPLFDHDKAVMLASNKL